MRMEGSWQMRIDERRGGGKWEDFWGKRGREWGQQETKMLTELHAKGLGLHRPSKNLMGKAGAAGAWVTRHQTLKHHLFAKRLTGP